MITDQVVAALAAEGYDRDRIRSLMDSLAEADWRDEDEDWSARDLATLRRQLGTPLAAVPDESLATEQSDIRADEPADLPADEPTPVLAYEPPDVPVAAAVSEADIDVWAADLARILERTTGGKNPLDPDQLRQVAGELLRRSGRPRDPKPGTADEPHPYVADFTVTHWADDLGEAIHAATGQVELSRVELEVAANLLLHAQEDDWVPHAALLRAEHERGPAAAS